VGALHVYPQSVEGKVKAKHAMLRRDINSECVIADCVTGCNTPDSLERVEENIFECLVQETVRSLVEC
jgi:hypothetical protein